MHGKEKAEAYANADEIPARDLHQKTIYLPPSALGEHNSEIFVRILFSWKFSDAKLLRIKPSGKGQIILLITDGGTSCSSHKFWTAQTCLSALYAKIKFLQKYLNLQ